MSGAEAVIRGSVTYAVTGHGWHEGAAAWHGALVDEVMARLEVPTLRPVVRMWLDELDAREKEAGR